MLRLAINGYGRIGRCVLRALYESPLREKMQIVAINEPADLATIAHLTRFDSTHGRFPGEVEFRHGTLVINGDVIAVSHDDDMANVDWTRHNIDVVLECSGVISRYAELEAHIERGARHVLLSQPGEPGIATIVYGLNHQELDPEQRIVSNASCTTNGIVPVIDVLNKAFGVRSGCITTIHSAMNDQPVLDAYHHTDLRKTRAAGLSMIPVDTGLAAGIGRIIPELDGRFAARAVRIPTHNVSAMELTVSLNADVSVEDVNVALKMAARGRLSGILGYSDEPLASCDFNHDPRSAIVDAGQTRVTGELVSLFTWFDNEWGYANRMLDVTAHWLS
ncbi:D-erythrose-4-phosphate dehydrogenase [Zhongshania aliphaticivorans]|uniref:D-erythrose-4-phosphate dehydrogenase n=1 Tax=Zhongshania aliphaticivorans TaxID=1470434 RepID=A0A5S9PNC9_9GAMM|nr:glyceraldehyde 3-phosphate dehydrogenase NAD-binding domain-containing protein [Zhongshania aliphaticivorans]CAA0105981.1 D-erythrose-4-phosphate dehydrogenase [Zhongshania aliphaticivorans]CAA0106176.1 D-erythrose-4-phosphate dehydrogenase [Zhongshania aliphaticivorans]